MKSFPERDELMTIYRFIRPIFTIFFLLALSGFVTAQNIPTRIADVERMTIAELQRLQTQEPVLIIDTRAPGQWVRAKDKIPGAIRLNSLDDLDKFKKEVPPDRAIVTYCT
jgi:hypothetical protein